MSGHFWTLLFWPARPRPALLSCSRGGRAAPGQRTSVRRWPWYARHEGAPPVPSSAGGRRSAKQRRGGRMSSTRFEAARDYAFADQALALRERAGLTQRELAALLGVSDRAIGRWEAGESYPGTHHLKQLIALYLERGALAAGREEEDAAALWEAARARAPRRTPPFDPHWFASLRRTQDGDVPRAPTPPLPATAQAQRRHDWGEAPDVPALQGRAQDLATLARWVGEERCRVV